MQEKKLPYHGPLDMKGFLGAAAVMGTLMYGAGHVWAGRANFCLHDHPDESFIDMLKQNCCLPGPTLPSAGNCGGLAGRCHQLS